MICERCGKDFADRDIYLKRPEDRENVCIWCAGEFMPCDVCGDWYHLEDLEMQEQADGVTWICSNCRK